MTALYRLSAGGGVFNTDLNAYIPPIVGNRRWDEYVVWAATNTADPAPSLSLSDYKAANVALTQTAAELKRVPYISVNAGQNLVRLMEYDEAIRCAADIVGNQDAAHYPLLNSLIPETAATVALVATALNLERLTFAANLAAIETVLSTAIAAINAAGSAAAVDAVVAAIVWP